MLFGIVITCIAGIFFAYVGELLLSKHEPMGALPLIVGVLLLVASIFVTDNRAERVTAHCFHHKEEILKRVTTPDKIGNLDSTCIAIFERYYSKEQSK